MKLKNAFNWPSKPSNNLNPWWRILWRIVWAVPLALCFMLTCVLVAISHGLDDARQLWREWM